MAKLKPTAFMNDLFAMTAIMGMGGGNYTNDTIQKEPEPKREGYDHRVRSEEEKQRKKEHKAKLKERRKRRSKNRR